MKNRYSLLQISLHWLTLLLIVLTYAAMLTRGYFPEDQRPWVRLLHYNFGIAVWVLVFIRIGLRHRYLSPPITPAIPQWQALLATLMHWCLYLLFLALPILGVLALEYGGRSLVFLGWQVPQFVTPDPATRAWIKNTHELLASVGYYVIALHALAALFHHYIVKDDTLKRMMPGK